MGLFTPKVPASRRKRGLAVLSIHSTLSMMTLLPNVQKATSSSATSLKLRRKALLIGVNGDFAPVTEDDNKWTDSEEETPHGQDAGSYRARSETAPPLKGPRKDVNGLRWLLISMLDINFIIDHC